MPTPEMLDGMRAPRSVRLEDMQRQAAAGEALPDPVAQDGVAVYVSKFKRYRVQITAPLHTVNPMTGQPIPGGRELVAQFEEGVFRNTESDPEARDLIDRTLQRNKFFGRFGSNADYWLASEQRDTLEKSRLKSALDTLKSLPREVVARFVADLQQGDAVDHKMPVAPEGGAASGPPSTRPIPQRG